MKVDPRWAYMEGKEHVKWFVARILTDDSIIIGMPAVEYDHLFCIDGFKEVSEDVYNAMDESRNKMVPPLLKDNVVPRVWYRLRFPPLPGMSGVKLSVREIFVADSPKDDTTLELMYHPNVSTHKKIGKCVTWWASWNVVCSDPGVKDEEAQRRRGNPDLKLKKDKAAQMADSYFNEIYGNGAPAPAPAPARNFAARNFAPPANNFVPSGDDDFGEFDDNQNNEMNT